MYTALPLIIIFFILLIVIRIIIVFSQRITFYATGIDAGFSFSEINMLWNLCSSIELDNPSSLFVTVNAIDKGIAQVKQSSTVAGTLDTPKIKKLLSALYEYRTKIDLDPKKNKGLKTTKSIAVGQRVHVLLKGYGVFTSHVLNNGRELSISLPLKDKKVVLASTDWVKKDISIYFYRYDDASYVFDARVRNSVQFGSNVSLLLPHTDKILRTQKRSGIRCTCTIWGRIFIKTFENNFDEETTEDEGTNSSLRCLIEDISEDGALIRIGGKGKSNLKLRLEFELEENKIAMTGIVRGVEYNEVLNISRMHFQCLEMTEDEKNHLLSYVYTYLLQEKNGVASDIKNEYNIDSTVMPEKPIIPNLSEQVKVVGAMINSENSTYVNERSNNEVK